MRYNLLQKKCIREDLYFIRISVVCFAMFDALKTMQVVTPSLNSGSPFFFLQYLIDILKVNFACV